MSELLDIRRQLGLSQESLAEKLGVNQSSVSRWERDGAPIHVLIAARSFVGSSPSDEGRAA